MAPTKEKGVHQPPPEKPSKVFDNELSIEYREPKQGCHPPPATRHRGILSLVSSVPLFDFGSRLGEPTLQALINESKNAMPLFNVESISTGNQQANLLDQDLVEIIVRFYGVTATDGSSNLNHHQSRIMKEIKSVMPKVWSPRMYLGALKVSIERNRSILIEAISFRGQRYISINDIHWLFTDENLSNPSLVGDRLISNAAYYNVTGGEMSQY